MKNAYKAALLAVLGLAGATSAQAQVSYGDLALGFVNGTKDYVINLGTLPAAANTDLSSLLNKATYNTAFGSSSVSVGIVGANNNGGAGSYVYTTTLRTGTIPSNYAVAGTETIPTKPTTRGMITSAGSLVTGINTGVMLSSDGSSFSSKVATGPTDANFTPVAGTYVGYLGQNANPLQAITGNIFTLDLWKNTRGTTTAVAQYQYVGDFKFDLSGSSFKLTYDPAAVPEPSQVVSMLALSALGGVAMLRRKKAISVS